ncbi:MAG: hypothetical protein E7165_02175 [Firmicutes bacterium]|nr:hypothetical protein [Bacillota bacterium]
MKAATSNAMLMNIIIVFIVVVMALLVTSISYTKAFRVKNRIIDIIEYHNGDFSDLKITDEINESLKSIGYRYNTGKTCPEMDGVSEEDTYTGSDYLYCIYTYNSARGKYYKVIAYMYFDLPIIGDYINIKVYGETKIFYG